MRGGEAALEEKAVKANELLFWLSARHQGSWQQFRAAVEELHSGDDDSSGNGTATNSEAEFPVHQQLRLDLERLAHVEFFARDCEKGWCVTPPTLAAHPVPDGVRAILCGARSPALRERVLGIGEKVGCETLDSRGVPEVIRLVARDTSVLAEVAAQTGVYFQSDAPLAILSYLPPCDPPLGTHRSCEFPQGADWSIHQFNALNLTWRKIERRQAQTERFGLLRFLIHFHRPRYFLRWKGATFELPPAVALYALLRRHRCVILRYDPTARSLSVPAICRPPRLLERALVLCSGLPPSYDAATVRLSYIDVPSDVARFAAELLRQPLT